VYAYPAEVSPLSRPNDADPFIADRFEFFLAGRRSPTASPNSTIPRSRRRASAPRPRKDQAMRKAMFYDADYIRALDTACRGRRTRGRHRPLVMFFTDSPSIRDVVLFRT